MVQPIWSFGFNATAFLPASIASLKRPTFISAIPSACQPSKKFASTSTQRWYFATALSSSPIARSPFASSKISSRVCSIWKGVESRPTRPPLQLTFGRGRQTGVALAIAQPFHKHVFARGFKVTLLERRLGFLIFRGIGRLAFFHQHNQSTVDPGNKVAHLARLKLSGHILDHHQVGRLVLRFFGRIFRLHFIGDRERLHFFSLQTAGLL